MKFNLRHFLIHVMMIMLAASLTSCSGNSFSGGGKKTKKTQKGESGAVPERSADPEIVIPDRTTPQPAEGNSTPREREPIPIPQGPLPREPLPSDDPEPSQLESPPRPEPEIDGGHAPPPRPESSPESAPEPAIDEGSSPQPAPDHTPSPSREEVGNLYFNVVPFVNMEHRIHATDPGTYVIAHDQNGKVLAAGPMTIDAACRGKSNGGMGYPSVMLNVGLSYIDPALETGALDGQQQGNLSICLLENSAAHPSEYQCRQGVRGANDSSRPAHWHERPFKFSIEGNQLAVNNNAGFARSGFGLQESVENGLTYAHPTAAGVCGSKAAQYADYSSPLVIDMDRSGHLDLISVWRDQRGQKIRFDLEGDGTKNWTGWVKPQDGLLAFDRNGNGEIDDGTELFGEYTAAAGGRSYRHGFSALAVLDSNEDGLIDAKDSAFTQLLVWQDRNSDGISQRPELAFLSRSVESISLAYKKTSSAQNFTRNADNEVRIESHLTFIDGKRGMIADVWFAQRSPQISAADVLKAVRTKAPPRGLK